MLRRKAMGRESSRLVGWFGGAALLGAATLGTVTIDTVANAGPEAPRRVSDAAADERRRDVAESQKDAEGYVATLTSAAKYKAGEKGSFTITLRPKAGYKVNGEFPVRFKTSAAPEGLTYTKTVLKREDGSFSDAEGTFNVEFMAGRAGTYPVGGTLSLSVCNDKNCLMEKVALDGRVIVE